MHKKRVLAVFVILQVVFTSMFPSLAFADEMPNVPVVSNYWQPSDAFTVSYVSNRFDAALALIGRWSSKIQIDERMYRKLSNESSGGDFYDLAQQFSCVADDGEPAWASVTSNFMAHAKFMADEMNVRRYASDWERWLWYGQFSLEDRINALRDFDKVLAGESLGGGPSDSGGLSTSMTLSGSGKIYLRSQLSDAGSIVLNFNSSMVDSYNNASPADGKYNVLAVARVVSATRTEFTWYIVKSVGGVTFTSEKYGTDSVYDGTQQKNVSVDMYRYNFSVASGAMVYSYSTFTKNWNATEIESSVLLDGLRNKNAPYSWTLNGSAVYGFDVDGGGGGGGNDGPNNWPLHGTPDPPPNDPTVPTTDPPEAPEIDLPDIDLPDPSVDIPVTIVAPDNTTAADYTPWLRAILTALNTIIDDMGEHCDHIRVAMRDYLNGLYEALSDDLSSYYDDLTDYLSDLAKWIVSHLNFDIKQPDVNVNVPGYDDSSVVGWLRRIYYKLRGTGTPRPDPIDDTDGALDWWTQFLQWITNALGGLLTDFVGDLGGFLQELMDTFPFSIPWDIVAMLTLLDAQRATPDVTFTIPGQNGWWNDITIRINLDAYDDAMATVRGMVLIWWMYILVMKTDWMMLLFDGANNAIGDFVSRLTGKG